MTQKELAGDGITRNMLSQIENGSSMPSLSTLVYLADRLGAPVGYLVSDGGTNETFYKKYSNYTNIVESYKSGEWAICRDLCLECISDGSDNEITYILAKASLHLGEAYFCDGNLRAAAKMFEETIEYSALTVFEVGEIIFRVSAYSELMSRISPSLILEIPESLRQSDIVCLGDICRFAAYISGQGECISIPPENVWKNPCYFYALSAKASMMNNNYEAAITLLSHICEENSLPKPIMYFVFDDYEKCCKETDDYKDAYELSQAKIQLFEKMLADI